MKKLILVISVVTSAIIASNAFASPVRKIAECDPQQPHLDHGYAVQIVEPMHPGSQPLAIVSMQSIAGPRPVATYTVRYVSNVGGPVGAGAKYVGRGFRLQYIMGTPSPDGRVPATMTFLVEGDMMMVESLYCRLY